MSLITIPDWLKKRRVSETGLALFQGLFEDNKEPLFEDITFELLKDFYNSTLRVDFYKAIRVIGFYGAIFSGKLSTYSGSEELYPEVVLVPEEYRENKIIELLGITNPILFLLKSLFIEKIGQLDGVPITNIKRIIECTSSVDNFLSALPVSVVNVTNDFFTHSQDSEVKGDAEPIEELNLFGRSISVLNLSVRPQKIIEKNGVKTLGELIQLDPEELLSTKNFGKTSLAEINNKLSKYSLKLGYKENRTTINIRDDEHCEISKYTVDILDLSVRAKNCLNEAKIEYVGQLMELSGEELLALPNLGRKTLAELKAKIEEICVSSLVKSQFILSFQNERFVDLNDDENLSKLSMHVNNLILSVRTKNVLNNCGINYIWQLVQLKERELLLVKNFGRKSLCELKERLSELGLNFGAKFSSEQLEKIISFDNSKPLEYLEDKLVMIVQDLSSEKISFLNRRENKIAHERLWPSTNKKRTLEDLAIELSVSRERVRQIERSTREKILQQYKGKIDAISVEIVDKINNYGGVIIINSLPFNIAVNTIREQQIIAEIFLLTNEKIYFDWEFNLVTTNGESWLNHICDSIIKRIQEICEDRFFLEDVLESAVNLILSEYKLVDQNLNTIFLAKIKRNVKITYSNGLFCLGRMLKQDKIALAFQYCFPCGLEIHKKAVELLEAFRKYDHQFFDSSNSRSIIARLTDHPDIFLWGRGFYIHRKHVVFDQDLVEIVTDWIVQRFDSGANKFQIDLAFDFFNKDLINAGIPNEYALYTLVRYLNNERIGQRKFPSLVDRLSDVNIEETVVEELERFLLDAGEAVSTANLRQEFICKRGWKDYRLQLSLTSNSDNIFPWIDRSYIHSKYLDVNYEKLKYFIEALYFKISTIGGAYSLKGARKEFEVLWHQVCQDAPITTMIKLIRNIASIKFEINHYLISIPNVLEGEEISLVNELEEYFKKENREISILELKNEFRDKRGWSDPQYYFAINKSTLFRMSKSSYVHPNTIEWCSDLYDEVQTVLGEELKSKNADKIPHIILSDVIDKYLLPELANDLEWTPELLISSCENRGSFIFFDDACVFVDNEFDIEDLDDMVAFLISQSFDYSLCKQKELEKLLWREGVLSSGRSLPHNELFFSESSVTYLEETKEITLSSIGEKRYAIQ